MSDTKSDYYARKLEALTTEEMYDFLCCELDGLIEQTENARDFENVVSDAKREIKRILRARKNVLEKAKMLRLKVNKVRLCVLLSRNV